MINEVLIAVLIPVGRNVAGWLSNSLKDMRIKTYSFKRIGVSFRFFAFQRYQVSKLFVTSLKIAVLSVSSYFGLNEIGIDTSILGSVAMSTFLEPVLKALKENKVVR